MKWTQVKWVLIAALLVTDLFLFLLILSNENGGHTVERAAIENLCELLETKGMIVSPDTVPQDITEDSVYRFSLSGSADSTDTALCRALSALAGSPVTGSAYLLPETEAYSVTFEDGDTASYTHGLYFTYTKAGYEDEITAAESADSSGITEKETGAQRSAEKTALAFLSRFTGLEPEGTSAVSSVRMQPVTEGSYLLTDGTAVCFFSEQLSGSGGAVTLSESRAIVLVRDGEVLAFCGTWLPFLPTEQYRVQTYNQLSFLYAEGERMEGTECTVESLQRVAYMLWDGSDSVFLRPAWQVSYGFLTVLADAVTGERVQTLQSGGITLESVQ